jgi:hypothetical protein
MYPKFNFNAPTAVNMNAMMRVYLCDVIVALPLLRRIELANVVDRLAVTL